MFTYYKVNEINLSRYVASFQKVTGNPVYGHKEQFMAWLKSLGFNDDQAIDTYCIATLGKAELESNLRLFLEKE